MHQTISNLTPAISLLLPFYLTYLCITPPHPPPRTPHPNDRFQSLMGHFTTTALTRNIIVLPLFLQHLTLVLLFPPSPSPSLSAHLDSPSPSSLLKIQQICLSPTNLDPSLFSWSIATTTYIVVTAAFAALRLASFAALGKSFTFQLAVPPDGRLITTGFPYGWVRHPSYTGMLGVAFANYWFFLRSGGGMGACVLPVEEPMMGGWMGEWGWWLLPAVVAGGTVAGAWVRVRDEERMLEEEFGGVWREYVARTWRFVPWIW
jgi:protein-S-isoprenylcysteine O-methyltransferase Ste14